MKKILLNVFALLSCSYFFAQGDGTIPNGDFEKWSNVFQYSNPNDWFTTNDEESYSGVYVIEKSSDRTHGNYSIKLGSAEVGSGTDKDTLMSYVFQGSITGNSGPDGGIPYTQTINKVRLQVKANFTNIDSLFLILIRFTGGTATEYIVNHIATNANVNSSSWSQIEYSFSSNPQEEIFIAFVLNNPFNEGRPDPSAWCLIDNVELYYNTTKTTNLPNNSFENWTDTYIEEPNDFYTANGWAENTQKTTDAYSGTYAAKLESKNYDGNMIPGILSLGQIDFGGSEPFAPVAYTFIPTTFSGAYKYFPQNGDNSGGIMVEFRQGGLTVGSHFELFSPQSTYFSFSQPLSISATPDEIVFVVFSGWEDGTVAFVDELKFTGGGVGLSENISPDIFNVYPNPAQDEVSISTSLNGNIKLEVYDNMGKLIEEINGFSNFNKLNISNYESGIYILKLVTGKSIATKKLVVK